MKALSLYWLERGEELRPAGARQIAPEPFHQIIFHIYRPVRGYFSITSTTYCAAGGSGERGRSEDYER